LSAAVVAAAIVPIAATAVAAAATAEADQDDDDEEPQTGTVVVSVVKAHDCHLALRPFYAPTAQRGPDRGKFPGHREKMR
jgi:hypothetical protein